MYFIRRLFELRSEGRDRARTRDWKRPNFPACSLYSCLVILSCMLVFLSCTFVQYACFFVMYFRPAFLSCISVLYLVCSSVLYFCLVFPSFFPVFGFCLVLLSSIPYFSSCTSVLLSCVCMEKRRERGFGVDGWGFPALGNKPTRAKLADLSRAKSSAKLLLYLWFIRLNVIVILEPRAPFESLTCYLILDTWYLIPDTWHLTLDTWYLIPATWYLIPDTWHLIPDTWHLIPDTWYDTWYLKPDTWYLISDTWYLIPDTWYLIPNTWYLIPDTCTWFLVLGIW